jgi:hypothetical protein
MPVNETAQTSRERLDSITLGRKENASINIKAPRLALVIGEVHHITIFANRIISRHCFYLLFFFFVI